MNPKIISIEGNIGSGKSTIIRKFDLYDLVIKEKSSNSSPSKNNLYVDREDKKLIFIN